MSASSSLSSSLSFLMQSKYSFCLSRAWPHTWEKTRERRSGRGEVGKTLDRHAATHATARHLLCKKHALWTQQANIEDTNKYTQMRTRLHAHRRCYWEKLRDVVEQTDWWYRVCKEVDLVDFAEPIYIKTLKIWLIHRWNHAYHARTCGFLFKLKWQSKTKIFLFPRLYPTGFNTVPVHLHCKQRLWDPNRKSLLFRHAKIQTVNADGSGYVLMPTGHYNVETAWEAKQVDEPYV